MLLLEFGIPFKMVNMMMECASSVGDTLLLNGGMTSTFPAKKGTRHGDPVYLFVLVRLNLDFKHHPKCVARDLLM